MGKSSSARHKEKVPDLLNSIDVGPVLHPKVCQCFFHHSFVENAEGIVGTLQIFCQFLRMFQRAGGPAPIFLNPQLRPNKANMRPSFLQIHHLTEAFSWIIIWSRSLIKFHPLHIQQSQSISDPTISKSTISNHSPFPTFPNLYHGSVKFCPVKCSDVLRRIRAMASAELCASSSLRAVRKPCSFRSSPTEASRIWSLFSNQQNEMKAPTVGPTI